MLTNLRDAFSGQSRSPYVVPFDMLDMVSDEHGCGWSVVGRKLTGADTDTQFDGRKVCRVQQLAGIACNEMSVITPASVTADEQRDGITATKHIKSTPTPGAS